MRCCDAGKGYGVGERSSGARPLGRFACKEWRRLLQGLPLGTPPLGEAGRGLHPHAAGNAEGRCDSRQDADDELDDKLNSFFLHSG